ncbi:MAG TPA: ATP-binding cassette domain-containing protein [Sphingobium sp.]|nr:ATP-binding cassette domain-containing protein [Sphingobium sp.]
MYGFHQCTKVYEADGDARRILMGATFTFGPRDRVAILAGGGAGKSTLIRLMGGLEAPTAGDVHRPPGTSWPIGFAGAFHPALTGEENVRVLATMLRADPDRVSAFVAMSADLGDEYRNALASYSSGMRARLAFAFSMAIPQDFYLADEVVGAGDGQYRLRSERMLLRRLETAGLLLVTRNPRIAERFVDQFAVLHRHRIIRCATIAEARELLAEQNQGEDELEALTAGLRKS